MELNFWSKVAVAVQTALAASLAITAITKANPAVATSADHGLTNGDVILLKVNGMTQLNYRVVRVAGVTTDSFQLEGIDSTGYENFTSGTAEEVTFGASASTLQDLSPSGGEPEGIPVRTIHTDQDFEIPGNRSPIVISATSLWDPSDPALLAIKGFDEIKTPGCVLVTFATGARIMFCAFMSANLAPAGSAGQVVTTPVSMRLRGLITNYAA
jgi:hypothetical protein